MKKFFKQLFCKHVWNKTGFIVYENGFGETYTRDILICQNCKKKRKGNKKSN